MEPKKSSPTKIMITALSVTLAGVWVILIANLYFRAGRGSGEAIVGIDGGRISARLAMTAREHYRGLSSTRELCADCGMLFVFSGSEERYFVMRDMNYPLDIIFINKGKISHIAANLQPEDGEGGTLYASSGPADLVLEVNAGYAAARGLAVGDAVNIESYED